MLDAVVCEAHDPNTFSESLTSMMETLPSVIAAKSWPSGDHVTEAAGTLQHFGSLQDKHQ